MLRCFAEKIIYVAVLFAVFWQPLQGLGQDPQFSQFFATRIYGNPAFAGNTHWGRMGLQYRNQWASLVNLTSYGVYYDHNIWRINSGLGGYVFQDWTGDGSLRYNRYAALYSYSFAISRKLAARLGLEASGNTFNVDLSKYVFTDQLITGSATTTDGIQIDAPMFFDASFGGIVYSEFFWSGISFAHLMAPRNREIDRVNPFSLKFTFNGGLTIPVQQDIKGNFHKDVSIAFNYKAQAKYDQLDLGAYYGFNKALFGIWYRGLPVKKNHSKMINADAIVLLVGFKYEYMRFGYSYDITISRLAGNSSGSHEVTAQVEFGTGKKQKRQKRSSRDVPCPAFGAGWVTD